MCFTFGVCSDSDPYQDYFEKQAEETKEKVAKNEYQRLRNISRTNKGRVRGTYYQYVMIVSSSINNCCIVGIITVKILSLSFFVC